MFDLAFTNLNDFLAMGKHGSYVWLCFALSFALIKINILLYQFKRKSIIKNIQLEQKRELKRQQNNS